MQRGRAGLRGCLGAFPLACFLWLLECSLSRLRLKSLSSRSFLRPTLLSRPLLSPVPWPTAQRCWKWIKEWVAGRKGEYLGEWGVGGKKAESGLGILRSRMVLGVRVGGDVGRVGKWTVFDQRHLSESLGDQGTMYKIKPTNHQNLDK